MSENYEVTVENINDARGHAYRIKYYDTVVGVSKFYKSTGSRTKSTVGVDKFINTRLEHQMRMENTQIRFIVSSTNGLVIFSSNWHSNNSTYYVMVKHVQDFFL